MSQCIDPAYVELIARNAILKLLADHTLQAGLRSCDPDCGWLGHEVRVATCAQLEDAIEEALGLQVVAFNFNPDNNLLTLQTNASTHQVDLSALEGGRPVALNVDAGGVLTMTTQDGTVLSTNLAAYVSSVITAALAPVQTALDQLDARVVNLEVDFASVGSLISTAILASYSSSEFQTAVQTMIDAAGIPTLDSFAPIAGTAPSSSEDPSIPTTIIGARTALLGQPDGFLRIAGKNVPFWDDECGG